MERTTKETMTHESCVHKHTHTHSVYIYLPTNSMTTCRLASVLILIYGSNAFKGFNKFSCFFCSPVFFTEVMSTWRRSPSNIPSFVKFLLTNILIVSKIYLFLQEFFLYFFIALVGVLYKR